MDSVTVTVPARLHLGFLDLNGGLGRKFGSMGLAINSPCTRITISRAAKTEVFGAESNRAIAYLRKASAALCVEKPLKVAVHAAIPAHAGLGSGTQLALAIAAGVRSIAGLGLDPRMDAVQLGRGARSGIGVALFEQGGAILDGGRLPDGPPPPVISRVSFPKDWRILLVHDRTRRGINGMDESSAFARLPEFSEEQAAVICRLVLMKAWPALIERSIEEFGSAISEIQVILGNHFAPAQGGRYTSPSVAKITALLEEAGAIGIGQSSWGPTAFAFARDATEGERLRESVAIRARDLGLELEIVSGNNTGAEIAPGDRGDG